MLYGDDIFLLYFYFYFYFFFILFFFSKLFLNLQATITTIVNYKEM